MVYPVEHLSKGAGKEKERTVGRKIPVQQIGILPPSLNIRGDLNEPEFDSSNGTKYAWSK